MVLALLSVAGGLVLLTLGAEVLVRGAASLGRHVGLSPLIIGLTVVSIGTSLPELVVSLDAVLQGNGALAIGNVVGSNISNIALILGLAALVQPMQVQAQVIRVDAPILVFVSLLLSGLMWDGALGRADGVLLTLGIAAYVTYNVRAAPNESGAVQEEFDEGLPGIHPYWMDVGFVVLGLGALVAGADVLVNGALQIARDMGVPQVVVGLTVVAVGTSLPELATSLLAAYRGNGDIAIGNAVGSSIFNVLGILGVTAVVNPISTKALSLVELAFMVGVAVLVLPLLRTQFRLSRREGGVLLFAYVGYLGYLGLVL